MRGSRRQQQWPPSVRASSTDLKRAIPECACCGWRPKAPAGDPCRSCTRVRTLLSARAAAHEQPLQKPASIVNSARPTLLHGCALHLGELSFVAGARDLSGAHAGVSWQNNG